MNLAVKHALTALICSPAAAYAAQEFQRNGVSIPFIVTSAASALLPLGAAALTHKRDIEQEYARLQRKRYYIWNNQQTRNVAHELTEIDEAQRIVRSTTLDDYVTNRLHVSAACTAGTFFATYLLQK